MFFKTRKKSDRMDNRRAAIIGERQKCTVEVLRTDGVTELKTVDVSKASGLVQRMRRRSDVFGARIAS